MVAQWLTARIPHKFDRRYTRAMHEFMSLKVSAAEHADLAMRLTTLSTQGWNVVNIVSNGSDLIAYLSRAQSSTTAGSSLSSSATTEDATGWASATNQSSPAPITAVVPAAAAAPAKWYPDPSGRYEFRYWDGSNWTDNVSRAGVMYKDPPVP